MDGGIDADAVLDYAEFHVFPSQSRFEAHASVCNKLENLTCGPLEQLLLHLPQAKKLDSSRSNAIFKLQLPENLNGAEWFTKSTLLRFLHIISSPDILNSTSAIENELHQLEEARRFHLSLYSKGQKNTSGNGETEAEVDVISSDATKNELLRAMDSRFIALREELIAALSKAAGSMLSSKEITGLEQFCHHFGATDLRNSFLKLIELSQKNEKANPNTISPSTKNRPNIKPSNTDSPVIYGVSPAKAAEAERQTSSESSHSSDEEEDDNEQEHQKQPLVERSRTLIRSASPRRSASPMRRIQIGRTGSRRTTALTVKSLSYFPTREKIVASHSEEDDDEEQEEKSDPPPKKFEGHVRRMSVQDAINLFESKQRDQNLDIQKSKTLLNASIGANKSVLRRWSSGMGENSVPQSSDLMVENNGDEEVLDSSSEVKQESSEVVSGEIGEANTGREIDSNLAKEEESSSGGEKLTSAEWSRQKEAELNQLLMKMMESKPAKTKYGNVAPPPPPPPPDNIPSEKKGGFYNHYKEKRDEKLRGEAVQKRVVEKKTEIDVGRKKTASKPQKTDKNSPLQVLNPKKDASKPTPVKKASSKTSSLPSTRKSWPSAPSPRAATGVSPAKTPSGGATTTPTGSTPRRKPVSSSAPRLNPKVVERSQTMPKTVKSTNKSVKGAVGEKNQQQRQQPKVTKTAKTTKPKIQTPPAVDNPSTAKPSFYNKVTKKSSVVPLESKPFLRKGSRMSPSVASTVKTKVPSQPEEPLRNSQEMVQADENEAVSVSVSDPPNVMVSLLKEENVETTEVVAGLEPEPPVNIAENFEDKEISTSIEAPGIIHSALENEVEEESSISPSAWVEIEEHQDELVPCDDDTGFQVLSTAPAAGMSSPRVRHSLSQMLLEESNEPDIVEWGNAEIPPAMVYQKDAPKGLKRLLKFARKSKGDGNSSGWSSPSVFSEGEDDAEEAKGVSKKNADNLMRKAALHGQLKMPFSEAYEKDSAAHELLSAQSNMSRFAAQSSSHKLQEGHVFSSASTTKGTRSFFSLSAFRGNKQI